MTSFAPKDPESPEEVALSFKLGRPTSEPGSAIHELFPVLSLQALKASVLSPITWKKQCLLDRFALIIKRNKASEGPSTVPARQ